MDRKNDKVTKESYKQPKVTDTANLKDITKLTVQGINVNDANKTWSCK